MYKEIKTIKQIHTTHNIKKIVKNIIYFYVLIAYVA